MARLSLHNGFFKEVFGYKIMLDDFLRHHLPPQELVDIDFRTVVPTRLSFLSAEWTKQCSDVVVKCSVKGKEGYIHVLFFNGVCRNMALCVLESTKVCLQMHLGERSRVVPRVIHMCMCCVEKKYAGTVPFLEEFGKDISRIAALFGLKMVNVFNFFAVHRRDEVPAERLKEDILEGRVRGKRNIIGALFRDGMVTPDQAKALLRLQKEK